jgi:hypothetical protein
VSEPTASCSRQAAGAVCSHTAPAFPRPGKWFVAAMTGALGLYAISALADPTKPRIAEPPVKVEIQARPITAFEPRDPSRRRFGQLEFRGGIELTSAYKEFGGISGLRVAADGARFLAVTDQGRWLRGRIVYDRGRPTDIADAEMAPVLGPDGKPLAARRWYDTEALAWDGGTVYVGIERVHQIVRFDYGKHGLLARGQPIAVPSAFKLFPSNKSIEGLVFVPKGSPLAGTLIAFPESALDASGNHQAFLIGGPTPGAFAIKRSDEFDIGDAALLPQGDLLILERRYSMLRGVAMRIRRIALAAVKPGALVDGRELIFADLGSQIDNMEGLAVHRTASGDTVLTLISDDNFSPIQRTVLLQFTLMSESSSR